MDDGGLSFDFEGGLDSGPTNPTASVPVVLPNSANGVTNNLASPAVADPGPGNYTLRRSFRQTVCRHWLRGLCMKADACGFLHQYDKARMPICRFYRLFGECREADCVYKHTDDDIKECNMYKLGFCPNGPGCRYRHLKLPGPPPPVEEVLQRFQQSTSYNYGNFNRFNQNRNGSYQQHTERPPLAQDSGAANQGVAEKSSTSQFPNMQPQQQVQPSLQQVGQGQLQSLANGHQNQENKISTPLPEGISRYFIVKSCNRENLELSVQQGVWATQRSNEAKLNEAFDSVENVILIFSVNTTRHFQGCAKMTSKIVGAAASGGNWKYANGGAHFGRNFSVKWLKLCELSFHKTRHLRNPYNENLPVKISRDCQELEPFIGEQLASLLYLEPDSELMAVSVAAEAKREEEKAKGTNLESGAENPDIVPFEDNDDEEEEEESDEDDEESYEAYQMAAQGRGRGRGPPMWPPQFPLGRGARPIHGGMRGFPPVMMGADGFPYGGGMRPDGFPMADPFGVGPPRPFGPFGPPRFPGDFAGPGPGMMFHGRPQPGGYGMGMGMGMVPGRAPFMGGGPARPGRPVGGMGSMFQAAPPPPPQQHSSLNTVKRDANKMNRDSGGGGGGGSEIAGGDDDDMAAASEQGGGNDDSGSEDEAPRRSRHGEPKKKRRTTTTTTDDDQHL